MTPEHRIATVERDVCPECGKHVELDSEEASVDEYRYNGAAGGPAWAEASCGCETYHVGGDDFPGHDLLELGQMAMAQWWMFALEAMGEPCTVDPPMPRGNRVLGRGYRPLPYVAATELPKLRAVC